MAALAEAFVAVRADTSKVQDDVSKGFGKATDKAAEDHGKKFGKAFGAFAGAAVVTSAVGFVRESVAAYGEAEASQERLADAFEKFPALADVNKDALLGLNSALQAKTRFDDDALASGQATLAQFGLTGQQIEQLTPLLADYAAKTGVDAPEAAEQLGKALLGQGRALKSVGIDFQDAGSVGANFDQIMGGLRTQVGGFAEKEGQTGAGQAAILANKFGDMQETVGGALLPVLQRMIDIVGTVIQFIQENIDVVQPLAIALGVLTVAVYAVNLAMSLNPIGIVVIALAALTAAVITAYQRSETFRDIVNAVWASVKENARIMWENVLQPIFGFLVSAFQKAWEIAGTFKDNLGIAFDAVWKAAQTAWGFIDRYFVQPFKTGIDGIKSVLDPIVGLFSNTPDWLKAAGSFFSGSGGAGGRGGGRGGGTGGFQFPLHGSGWSVGVGLGGYPGHTGQDFPTPVGTPVYAPMAGLASALSLGNRSYGNYELIRGAGGVEFIAAHLSSAIANGPVAAGQLIGFSGSTGNSTGPHLHAEFRQNGAVVDPRRFLSFDSGGWLPVGPSLTVNNTGQPERIMAPHDQMDLTDDSVDRLAAAFVRGVQADRGMTVQSLRAGVRS